MKKHTFIALLLVGSLAFAQERTQTTQGNRQGRNRSEMTNKSDMDAKRLEQMKQDLNLSDEQVAKIKAINEKYDQGQKGAWDKNNSKGKNGKDSKNKNGGDLRQQKENEIKGVLDKDQAAKYETLKSQRSKGFQNNQQKSRGEFNKQRSDSTRFDKGAKARNRRNANQ